MAIHDRDYMKQPASPSEFPEAEDGESATSAPFNLFAGVPEEPLTLVETLKHEPRAPQRSVVIPETSSKPNYWMIAIIASILAIVVAAVALN
jgi:hypothetical protein